MQISGESRSITRIIAAASPDKVNDFPAIFITLEFGSVLFLFVFVIYSGRDMKDSLCVGSFILEKERVIWDSTRQVTMDSSYVDLIDWTKVDHVG